MNEQLILENIESAIEKLFQKYAIDKRDYWTIQDIAIYHNCSVKTMRGVVKSKGFPEPRIKKGTTSQKVWCRRKVVNYLSS